MKFETSGVSMVSLKDITPSTQNNINTQFIILDKSKTTTMEGQYKACFGVVADETAVAFEAGDIVHLTYGIFSLSHHNNLFTMVFVETPNMSEISWVRDPNNSNKYVQEQQAVISASMP
ncbi:hypothetical protein Pint_11407 [Pistacia integerrima]|uniref:Uncharacterized protein n=1 Tax=Pistacia integerrima TaxID=434235 RepID=A0ACC0XGP9_9ROSI|nr:hypothetical protein Pint_11407 [Pistacia integerrima]